MFAVYLLVFMGEKVVSIMAYHLECLQQMWCCKLDGYMLKLKDRELSIRDGTTPCAYQKLLLIVDCDAAELSSNIDSMVILSYAILFKNHFIGD